MKKSIRYSLIIIIAVLLALPAGAKKKEKKKEAEEAGETITPDKVPIRTETVFGIYPPVIDLECQAGQRVSTTVKVDNPHKLPGAYQMLPVGVVAGLASELMNRPIASLPANHLSRHIIIESDLIVVPGKSYRNVAVYIDVPAELTGTQYTGLTVTNVSPSMAEPGLQRKAEYQMDVGLGMQPGIGVTIKCHITGTEKFAYSLARIDITPPVGNQPLSAKAQIKNTGNAEIPFSGTLILIDSQKKVVAKLKTERNVALYPGSVIDVAFQPVFKDIPNGTYKAVIVPAVTEIELPTLGRQVVVKK